MLENFISLEEFIPLGDDYGAELFLLLLSILNFIFTFTKFFQINSLNVVASLKTFLITVPSLTSPLKSSELKVKIVLASLSNTDLTSYTIPV